MLVLKLAYSEDLDFIEELQELKSLLKKKSVIIGLVESIEGNTHVIKIMCEEDKYSDKVYNIINLYISNILYRIVIDKYKEKEMYEFLTDTYFFLKQEEILEVEESIMKVLNCENINEGESFVYCSNKINEIIEKIKDCIEENKEININGFIMFRMKELREDIESVIDKVIEKYMVEKEYKEFIRLLKYFVDIQESKIEEVNIFIKTPSGYTITDGNGEDVFNIFLKDIAECKVGVDTNIEDVIISGLITNAPNTVIIHQKEACENMEFLDTIVNVFGSRVTFCEGCKSCSVQKDKIK